MSIFILSFFLSAQRHHENLELECQEIDEMLAKEIAQKPEAAQAFPAETLFGNYIGKQKALHQERAKLESLKIKLDQLEDEVSLASLAREEKKVQAQIDNIVSNKICIYNIYNL